MKIVVQLYKMKTVDEYIDYIYRKYRNKIKSVKKMRREIELINGDFIKLASTNGKYNDGLRADVAIGPDAEIITCCSTYKKRVWDFEDLEEHLSKI